LFHKLSETPAANDAWFWKVQCHIFQYLISRYGESEMKNPQDPQQQIEHSELPHGSNPVSLGVKPSNSFTAFLGAGKMPRASRQIGPALRGIVQVNQDRYQILQRFGEELAETQRIEQTTSRDLMLQYRLDQLRRNLMRKYVQDLREKLNLHEAQIVEASDDEIKELFSKLLAMDPENPENEDTKADGRV